MGPNKRKLDVVDDDEYSEEEEEEDKSVAGSVDSDDDEGSVETEGSYMDGGSEKSQSDDEADDTGSQCESSGLIITDVFQTKKGERGEACTLQDTADNEMFGRVTRFAEGTRESLIRKSHPELIPESDAEMKALCRIVRNAAGVIVDPNHQSLPKLTDDERTRVLALRCMMLSNDADSFLPEEEIGDEVDEYPIALKEFEQGHLDDLFVIKRPTVTEYWRLGDLR